MEIDRSRNRKRKLFASLIALLAIVAGVTVAPRVGHAWVEATRVDRRLSPAGCLKQETALQHGGSNDEVRLQANLYGMTADCRNFASSVLGAATVRYFVLKKNNTSITDTAWSYCAVGTMSVPLTTGKATKSFPAPPCGPGYYGVAMCLDPATAWTRNLFGGLQQIGSISTCHDLNQYNVTPMWHPAFNSPPSSTGPAIVWPMFFDF